jgi:hypothetical protein
MKCSVKHCGIHSAEMLAIIDDGRKRFVLCPDHQLSYALSELNEAELDGYASQLEEHECEICCMPASIYADEVELHLCKRHLSKLIRRSLSPMEYRVLYERHQEFQLINGQIYAKGGYALQPVAPLRQAR